MRSVLAIFVGMLVFVGWPAFAKASAGEVREYPDPDNPGVRVREFVHEPRPGRPETVTGAVACVDPNSNAFVHAAGWKLPNNVTYSLNLSSPMDQAGAAAAFKEWATPSGVTFTRGMDTGKTRNSFDSQNIVAWGKTPGNALGVTYVRYYTATKMVADVDTIMNSRVKWSWNQCTVDSYDALGVLTHEIGHWVGLEDEYTASYVDNTMFGYADRAEIKKSTLEAGDIEGVGAIY